MAPNLDFYYSLFNLYNHTVIFICILIIFELLYKYIKIVVKYHAKFLMHEYTEIYSNQVKQACFLTYTIYWGKKQSTFFLVAFYM